MMSAVFKVIYNFGTEIVKAKGSSASSNTPSERNLVKQAKKCKKNPVT